MDSYSGYNQIRMSEKNASHRVVNEYNNIYYYTVMHFGLINDEAIY